MKYFIDSTYIIALVNEKDSLHEKLLKHMKLVKTNEYHIFRILFKDIKSLLI